MTIMGRPKPKRSSHSGWIQPVRLTRNIRLLVAEALNIPKSEKNAAIEAAEATQEVLAMYDFYHEELDNHPTPASRRDELKPLVDAAKETLKCLRRLSEAAVDDVLNADSMYAKRLIDLLRTLPSDLNCLADAAALARDELNTVESRRGKRKDAIKLTVGELKAVFERFYRPPSHVNQEDRRGALYRYISVCLLAHKISKPNYKTFRSMLYQAD
jgi:hypothetical protein